MAKKAKVGGFHTPFAQLAAVKETLVPPPPVPAKGKPVVPPARGTSAGSSAGSSAGGRERVLSDEELFLQEVGGVRPVPAAKSASKGRVGPAPTPPTTRKSEDAEVLAQLADLCDGAGAFDLSDGDEYIEGVAPGVDRRLLKRLRAGDFALQAHLDLHGMTRAEAKEEVVRFVAQSRKEGRRSVLIVHGRGLHSKDQLPVLKEAVRTWLERGAVARAVLAFATARPADGGAGAVAVLLRR